MKSRNLLLTVLEAGKPRSERGPGRVLREVRFWTVDLYLFAERGSSVKSLLWKH